ncbi:MAG: hypothetical protein M5R36_18050 [Deltaproteobacteria bacterium]|nr:hypothetical protein [Deltaproteobacteria bacterium]
MSIYVPLIALATAYLMSPAGSWRRIGNTVIGVVIVGQLALMLYLFYASKNSAAEPWTVFDGLFFRSEERLVRQDSHSVFHVNFTPPPCRNIGTALAHHYPAGSNVNVTGAAPAGDPTEIAQAPERHDGVGSCDLPDYLLSAFRGGTRAVDGDLADRVNPAQAILVAFPAADFAEAKQRLGVFWPKIRAAYPTYEVLTLVWDGDQPGNVGSGNFHVLMAPPLR